MNRRRLLPHSGLMAEFDVAVFGTNLLSGLLAGLLAREHGKKVVRVGRRPSAQRLWRGTNMALPLTTRPRSWQILRRAETETRALLESMGAPQALASSEITILADMPDTALALDHMMHMAVAYGHQVRRVTGGWAVRRVAHIDRDVIDGRMAEWLTSAGVASIDEGPVDAAQNVLADDDAILEQVPEDRRPPHAVVQPMATSLIVAPRGLASPVMRYPDRGITLLTRPGNTVLAVVSGERDSEARLASVLGGPFPMKRLASTRYRRVITGDGAPLIGRLKSTRLWVVAGLGDSAAFVAPALARMLAGASEADEKAWFAAHDPNRPREPVVDYVPAAELAY